MSVIIGIDPGAHGAVAAVDHSGTLLNVDDLPYAGGALLAAVFANILRGHRNHDIDNTVIWLEQITPRPNEGVKNIRASCENFGQIRGVIAALEIPVHFVTPATWKRNLSLNKDKGVSRRRASDGWPSSADKFRRVKDDGRAEAALIAEYGRRQELRP